MESQADKEKKFTSLMEKGIMYFLYILFGGLFIFITWNEGWNEAVVLIIPTAAITLPLTKWGVKWQNERYIRSAKNQDDLEVVLKRVQDLESRISKLEEK